MFSKTAKVAAFTAALLAGTAAAHADLKMIGNYGPWKTYAGIADNGRPMCSSQLVGQDRVLMVKYQAGYPFLQVSKVGWRIPVKQDVDIVMEIDRADPIVLKGFAVGKGDTVEIPLRATADNLDQNAAADLVGLLVEGLQVKLSFPNGTEQPWQGPLTGSAAALNRMIDCMKVLNETSPSQVQTAPTQPYSSQPFGGPASTPTQPVAPTQPIGPFRGV